MSSISLHGNCVRGSLIRSMTVIKQHREAGGGVLPRPATGMHDSDCYGLSFYCWGAFWGCQHASAEVLVRWLTSMRNNLPSHLQT